MKRFATVAITTLLVASAAERPLAAQPLTERTPNLAGSWVVSPWGLYFQFAHRFQTVGEDADIGDIFDGAKIVNYPTFDLALGLVPRTMIGVRYSSNSIVAGGVNEWQPYFKYAPLQEAGPARLGLSIQAAWNTTNESADGELAGQTFFGPVFLSAAARGFTNMIAFGEAEDAAALALAGGGGVKINRYITLAGDIAGVVAGPERDPAWGAGLHIGIPFTPHTFSIMATNVTSGTLQGTSGVPPDFPNEVYWGFEFTVPFSGFARWGKIFNPDEIRTPAGREAAAEGRAVVEVEMKRVVFQQKELRIPVGTTVRWVNKDPVAHTSTSDDGVWSSPSIGPGETFEFTFTQTGEFAYHCVPHPFMTATIIVEP